MDMRRKGIWNIYNLNFKIVDYIFVLDIRKPRERFSRISHRGCQRCQREDAVLIARFTGFELQLTGATLHKHLRNA